MREDTFGWRRSWFVTQRQPLYVQYLETNRNGIQRGRSLSSCVKQKKTIAYRKRYASKMGQIRYDMKIVGLKVVQTLQEALSIN